MSVIVDTFVAIPNRDADPNPLGTARAAAAAAVFEAPALKLSFEKAIHTKTSSMVYDAIKEARKELEDEDGKGGGSINVVVSNKAVRRRTVDNVGAVVDKVLDDGADGNVKRLALRAQEGVQLLKKMFEDSESGKGEEEGDDMEEGGNGEAGQAVTLRTLTMHLQAGLRLKLLMNKRRRRALLKEKRQRRMKISGAKPNALPKFVAGAAKSTRTRKRHGGRHKLGDGIM